MNHADKREFRFYQEVFEKLGVKPQVASSKTPINRSVILAHCCYLTKEATREPSPKPEVQREHLCFVRGCLWTLGEVSLDDITISRIPKKLDLRNLPPASEEIMARVIKVVVEQIGDNPKVSKEEILPTHRLVEDLGADSLDEVEITTGLEEEFDIDLPDDETESVTTVGEAAALVQFKLAKKTKA